jgi:hypothetical protein
VPRTMPGQVIDPPPDRLRGFTAVLVHLSSGPPPSPDGQHYNILALGPEKPVDMNLPQRNSMMRGAAQKGMMRRTTPGKSAFPQPPNR